MHHGNTPVRPWSSWLLWSFSVQSRPRFRVSDEEYFILSKNKIIVEL